MTDTDTFKAHKRVGINNDLLIKHPKVQRGRFSQSHADQIAADFDPDLFGELTVVPVGGRSKKFYVIDGEHRRVAALKALGPGQELPCDLYETLELCRQAEIFLGRNSYLGMTPLSRWPSRVLAKHPDVLDIEDVLHKRGLRVAEDTRDGVVRAVVALQNIYKSVGRDGLARVLDVLGNAYGKQQEAYEATMLRGLAWFLKVHGESLDDKHLSHKLSKNGGPARFIGQSRDFAKLANISVIRAAANRLVGIYNKGRRTNLLPTD